MITVMIISLSIITLLCYATATALQLMRMHGRLESLKCHILGLAWVTVVMHALLLHQWIDTASGQNLTYSNVISQVAWIIALLVALMSTRKPIDNLGVFAYPFAGFSILLVLLVPGHYIVNTGANPKQLIHILLSFLAVSVFFMAASQAVLLATQERLLKQKHTLGIVRAMPPIEAMENLLFQLIWFGFILLSFVLITAFVFFPNIFAAKLLQHTLLAMMGWLVFAILLLGRHRFGWRGRTAVRWTLGGVTLLVLSYFGSRLLLELLI